MAKRAPGIKRANQEVGYTQEQMIELYKCSIDPIYFITTYVKIRHPKHGQIKFNLHDYQRDMVMRYKNNRFNILLSARQTGKTETSCAYLLWYAIFHPDKTVLIASNKSSNAMELIGKIQYAYEELPNWLKPGIDDTNWNKHTCTFDNKSRIVASATSKDSGRGLAISLIYCDELAFVAPHVQVEFWDSILPTISTGGAMIITSTPNGDSNLFARTWFNSISKTPEELAADPNAFIPLHVKWNQPPGRDDDFKKQFMDKLGERKWRQEFECVAGDTMITVRNTETKLIENISIAELRMRLSINNSLIIESDTWLSSTNLPEKMDLGILELLQTSEKGYPVTEDQSDFQN